MGIQTEEAPGGVMTQSVFISYAQEDEEAAGFLQGILEEVEVRT